MDLKDVVQNVRDKADEAVNSFHAGHHDNARHYLAGIRAEIVQFETANPTPADDVTGSATSEQGAGESQDTPAEVPGSQALPATQFEEPGKKQTPADGPGWTPAQ